MAFAVQKLLTRVSVLVIMYKKNSPHLSLFRVEPVSACTSASLAKHYCIQKGL